MLQYNTWDLISKITAPSPTSYVTDLHYDLNRNLVRIERQSGNAEDPQTTTYTYNQRDWITSISNELSQITRFVYDANGNVRTATDPAGRVTTWTHDERNLLYETRDALGQTTRLFYNSNGLLSEVVDAKDQSTRYAYDSYDRLRSTTHADATTEQRAYDRVDNLVRWTTRAGQVLRFTYDSQNRRISKVTPAGTTRYGYDLGSRLVRVAGPGATLTFGYNARDQLVTETTQPAGRSSAWTVSRVYDGEDNVTALTYPDGSVFHTTFDALNRLTAVQNAAKTNLVSHSWDALSRMTQSDRRSGARSTYTFDEADRLSTLTHKASATATTSLLSLTASRNAVGQITSLTDDFGATTFSYDAAYRLTGAQAPATAPYPDLTIAYDKAGNRKSLVATPQAAPAPSPAPQPSPAPSPAPPTPPSGGGSGESSGGGASGTSDDDSEEGAGDPPASPAPAPAPAPSPPATPSATTTAYTTNNLNQYTRVGAATYTYNRNGALTSDGTNTYRWDAENRLTGATIPGATPGAPATTVSYVYDEFDRRVKKTVGTATTYYLWSGDDLLAEYAADGTLQRRYLYATGFAPAQVHHVSGATSTAYDVHTDHLDTPRLLTNSTGAAVWRSRHQAFGRAHIEGDPDNDGTSLAFPFRFPGQYEDPETGLHYNRYRYYSPEIGRYLSPDPLGQFDSAHLYQYAANDPIHLFDPYGLYSWSQFRQDARFIARNSAQGAAAWADGMIPFFDPFAAAGAYNPCDPTLAWSRTAGEISAEFNALGRGGQFVKLFRKLGQGVKSASAANKGTKVTRAANPQGPRRHSQSQRERIKERATDERGNTRCEYCGQRTQDAAGRPNSFETDHIDPYSRGGKTNLENAAASCRTCNRKKGARTPEEAGMRRPR